MRVLPSAAAAALALLLSIAVPASAQQAAGPPSTAAPTQAVTAGEPIAIVWPASTNEDGEIVDQAGNVITPAPAAGAEQDQADTEDSDVDAANSDDSGADSDDSDSQDRASTVAPGGTVATGDVDGDSGTVGDPIVVTDAPFVTIFPPLTEAPPVSEPEDITEGTVPPPTEAAAPSPAPQEPSPTPESSEPATTAAGSTTLPVSTEISGSRDLPAGIAAGSVPSNGSVTSRFPLAVNTPEEVYSERLDNCVKTLVSNETETDVADWSLVGADESEDVVDQFDVTYDVQVPTEREEDVNTGMLRYVNSGDLDKDIASRCDESANVTFRGSPRRASTGGTELTGRDSRGRRVAAAAIGTTAALAAVAVLAGLGIALAKRRNRESSADQWDRSVQQFGTSENNDPEAGNGNMGDSHDPAILADRLSPPVHGTISTTTDEYSRPPSSQYTGTPTPIMEFPRGGPSPPIVEPPPQNEHDYHIGVGPVTGTTPAPPVDYVARDSSSAIADGSDPYASLGGDMLAEDDDDRPIGSDRLSERSDRLSEQDNHEFHDADIE